ncbi:MAG: molybdenum cofactor biosynthesis protein MoaE [Solirubrobacteraceae bacterium]|jgi:molybdopterin synthase catalytic subunit
MTVTVRLFAVLRERAGSDRMELQLPDGATVADALQALSKIPSLAGLLERIPVQMAVNRDYASPRTPLGPDDELALIPPLSGGANQSADPSPQANARPREGVECVAQISDTDARVHVAVTDGRLSLETLARAVSDPRAGAIVSFQGVTREVDHLDYEAYSEMARERITLILRECMTRHGLCAAAAEHRIGSVALGECSVIVAVSAPHRTEAFAGAREIIDRIKAEAPIWKREVDSDGLSRRVAGTPAPGAEVPSATTTRTRRDERGG